MSQILPARFLFRYSFDVRALGRLPRPGKRLLAMPNSHQVPDLGSLDESPGFAELRMGWNAGGIGLSVEVKGKTRLPEGDAAAPDLADALHVWIDTRNTQNIHRASRFCHCFCFLPRAVGLGNAAPAGLQRSIARANEPAPLALPEDLRVWAEVTKSGYLLEAWLPAAVLNGYDPETQPRLGFYYLVRDRELGEQTFGVGAEFPYAFDPSLWATAELVQ